MNLIDCERYESILRFVYDLKSFTVDGRLYQNPHVALGLAASGCIERDKESFGYVWIRLSRCLHFLGEHLLAGCRKVPRLLRS